jgi:hypothetical protein
MGSDSSASSLDLDEHLSHNLKNPSVNSLAAVAGTAQAPRISAALAGTTTAAASGQGMPARGEAVAGSSSMRPQSSAGRRGQPGSSSSISSSASLTKELQAGRRPSGALHALR